MKRAALWGLAAIGLLLAGCGSSPGPRPISHGMTPTQVKNEVLSRLGTWRAVSETVDETMTNARGIQQVFRVDLVEQVNPPSFRLKVVPQVGSSYEVLDNGFSIIEYQHGARHYTVMASSSAAWADYRLMGTELLQSLKSSRMVSVSVKSKEAVLHMMTPMSPGVSAKATLWFNLVTNTPSRWQAVWKGGSIVETPSNIAINPSLAASTFQFSPPSGVKPEVGLSPQGTELDQAQARVPFAIVLPPRSQNLDLRSIDVGSENDSRVVLLTYQTTDQDAVVITESKAAHFKPPAGLSMVTETTGTLRVQVGTIPDGEEMAVLSIDKTSLVVEGPTAAVDSLVNAWANAPSLSSSP